jgi:hypothetical protein
MNEAMNITCEKNVVATRLLSTLKGTQIGNKLLEIGTDSIIDPDRGA